MYKKDCDEEKIKRGKLKAKKNERTSKSEASGQATCMKEQSPIN